MRRRRWLIAALVFSAVLAVAAVPVVRARATHDRELKDLRVRTMRALAQLGVHGEVVSAGIDDGGSGSADCGVHVVIKIVAAESAVQIARQLAAVGFVFQDGRNGSLVLVAAEPASTGADTLLDLRCRGSIPFERQQPVR